VTLRSSGGIRLPGRARRYLAGTGRQFGADLDGEVQVRLAAGQLLQAFGDERGGLGDVTAALREPRAQEVEFGAGERRAGDEPVQQFVLGGSREPVEEHLVPRGEIVRPLLAPVAGLIEGSVHGARPSTDSHSAATASDTTNFAASTGSSKWK
jgi:hypothetical protein